MYIEGILRLGGWVFFTALSGALAFLFGVSPHQWLAITLPILLSIWCIVGSGPE